MKKRILFTILLVMAMFFCFGCENKETQKEEIKEDNFTLLVEDGYSSIYNYIDKETGVNYIIYLGLYKGGITPRYTESGDLYITKE